MARRKYSSSDGDLLLCSVLVYRCLRGRRNKIFRGVFARVKNAVSTTRLSQIGNATRALQLEVHVVREIHEIRHFFLLQTPATMKLMNC